MFSGLTTLSTLKDVLNYSLDGYLCVVAFTEFPSLYVWPQKPEETSSNVGCHFVFITVHIFILQLTDLDYSFIQNREVSFLIGEIMSQNIWLH